MEKRYQVFVSSTYRDLVEERQQVIQALLMLNCFPCGMEYFPAGDDEVWEAIKKLIDACDYYIVIVAGKYGTVDKASGQSFTEKEYRYALERNKRIAGFLHFDMDSIPRGKTEQNAKNLKKLKEFRKLCGQKMCSEWTSAADLKTKVIASLVHLMKQYPATGWVPANLVPDESAAQTILRLRNENDELRRQSEAYAALGPPNAHELASGDEVIELRYSLVTGHDSYGEETLMASQGVFSWNEIFLSLANPLMTAANEISMLEILQDMIGAKAGQACAQLEHEDFQRVKIQLRALGLIMKNPSGEPGSWTLTPYGELQVVKQMAIRSKAGQGQGP